jgi:ArsR family transcriptional regulator
MGCGTGALLKLIVPRIGKTIAVDYSEAMLNACRKNIATKYHPQIDLRLGYLEHLPVADAEVDQAVCYMVLHYLADPLAAFNSVQRVLKAGGQLKIIDLTAHHNELLRETYAHQWLGFSEKELRTWTEQAGFTNFKYSLLGKSNEAFFLTCTKK